MTRRDLQQTLNNLGISKTTYSLEGGSSGNKYVLSQERVGKWSVYHCEKGLILSKRLFTNEGDACEYLLRSIMSDARVFILGARPYQQLGAVLLS